MAGSKSFTFRFSLCSFLFLFATVAYGQSGLNERDFNKYWRVESESKDFRVTFHGDTCELLAPKGLTLWRKQRYGADTVVEYDAMVVDEGREGDRLSDMNCFWLASDPQHKDIWQRAEWRSGVFVRCYTLQTYYLGYGGNHNSTTRFRRYTGDEAGVADTERRPPVLKEYTDKTHLLQKNHWYHVRIVSCDGRVRFYVDGELLVDYNDPTPLTSGWFGFRTTLSRTRITNFRTSAPERLSVAGGIPLRWVANEQLTTTDLHEEGMSLAGTDEKVWPVTFGIPFRQGELRDVTTLQLSSRQPCDTWVTARWPDGSVKWAAMAAVVPWCQEELTVTAGKKQKTADVITVDEHDNRITVNTGQLTAYLSACGAQLIDSLVVDGRRVGGAATLTATTAEGRYVSHVDRMTVERKGGMHAVVKIEGTHIDSGRSWLPFVVRLYFYGGSCQVKMVHSLVYDGEPSRDMITSLGVCMAVPMRTEPYNRHIAFATDDGVWAEPVQPLDGRRELRLRQSPPEEGRGIPQRQNIQLDQMSGKRIPPRDAFDRMGRSLIDHWAQWDGFRLSQLTDNAYAIRKRATSDGSTPWIGTLTGRRSPGYAFVGDVEGGLGVAMQDFWQSYPSTMEVRGARCDEASLTMYLWSPEAEPMNLCHYDTIAHGLAESYEDVQPGMSSPYGIGRTTTLWLLPQSGYPGRETIARQAARLTDHVQLLPTPQYLHDCRAFGIWSLPTADRSVEQRLDEYVSIYQRETERHKWYGFWNYGDVMHAYDPERDEWRYDVGGYAWDNTELASPTWLWTMFLRSGRADIWRMAEAMTRHNSEVDTYHIGPFAPLGSRHNVSHWGCGAKEARISQSAFLRYYYYLTADERTGDLMTAQTDADTLLWHLDPMRLAEPKALFPCNAPARLRIGPDWLAYAGNWMTEWERTGNVRYRDKIVTGMQSIARLHDGIFTGNLAKGYDPATGVISYDGPDSLRSTSHLLAIMGGFEMMNELLPMVSVGEFGRCWLDHARRYKAMAWQTRKNRFPVRRLEAYAAWLDRDVKRKDEVWQSLLAPNKGISTNDAAMWSLDAIYMLETIGR